MSDLIFEEPPAQATPWVERLAPLIDHPGRWVRIDERPSPNAAQTVASYLRQGIRKRPPGRWEFTSRGCRLYAKYVGPAS